MLGAERQLLSSPTVIAVLQKIFLTRRRLNVSSSVQIQLRAWNRPWKKNESWCRPNESARAGSSN